MPRNKLSGPENIKTLPGGAQRWSYQEDTQKIICSICVVGFDYKASNLTFRVKQHADSSKHKKQVQLHARRQSAIDFTNQFGNKFYEDLTETFLSANIPLHKLQNEKLKTFIEEWTGKSVPDPSTLRKIYIPKQYDGVVQDIRTWVQGENYYIMIDEATDPMGRFIIGVLIGVLSDNIAKPRLFEVIETEKTDSVAITQTIITALGKLFMHSLDYSKFCLLVSDGASYMLKAGKTLKTLFPGLLHVTCLAHGVNRLAEFVRSQNPHTRNFILKASKIFSNCSRRQRLYREVTGLPLPPTPVPTRWSSWLNTCFYYGKHFHEFRQFLEYEMEEEPRIGDIQVLFESMTDELRDELGIVFASFSFLPEATTKLQGRLSLCSQITILEDIIVNVQGCAYRDKLECILAKNPDLKTLRQYSQILNGVRPTNLVVDPTKAVIFRNAPLVSADIERVFSGMKDILAPKRLTLSVENIKQHLVLYWNNANN